jgi:hypothetical protein
VRAIIIISILALFTTGCARKIKQVERHKLHTAVSDCTVVKTKLIDVPVSIPADSVELGFTIVTVKDEQTGRITVVPMKQTSQSGRAKATTTIDAMGNIMTKANCDAVEKDLQVAITEKEHWRKLYESELSYTNHQKVIVRNPWWIIPLVALCMITTLTLLIHKFIKPFKFLPL